MASRRNKFRQGVPPHPGRTMADAAAEIYRSARPVAPDEITYEPDVQVRVGGLDWERVERYARFVLEGGAFDDPIVLFREGRKLILSAGYHRCAGYTRAMERFSPTPEMPHLAPLMAEIREGGLAGAIEFAEEDNLAHGLELRAVDKKRILERRWARGHPWQRLSNRALAAKLGVSDVTVMRWRAEIEGPDAGKPASEETGATATNVAVGESSEGESAQKRVGKDGREYDVSNIQAAAKTRARPAPRYVSDPEIDQTADEWTEESAPSDNGYQIEAPAAEEAARDQPVATATISEAEIVSQTLHTATVEVITAIDNLAELRDISALRALPAGTRDRHWYELGELHEHTRSLVAYCEMQMRALREMGG